MSAMKRRVNQSRSECTGFSYELLCVPRANTSNREIKVALWGKISIGFLSERSTEETLKFHIFINANENKKTYC
jgi:hypothetical protein